MGDLGNRTPGSITLPRRLNLGCGLRPLPDCVNVDLRAHLNPDLVWDLDRHPYPLPEAHFDQIFAFDVVEHLDDIGGFMAEAHRLLAPGGTLEMTTPHFSCANSYTDPTHRRHLGYFSFDYFTAEGEWNFYSLHRFEIVERLLVFRTGRLQSLIARLANRNPARYERTFAWVWPAWFLIFKLRAVPRVP